MVEIVKQGMTDIWASSGDVVMPDVGKIQEGWLVEVPPRQYWNWMQNRTDTNLGYIFQRGIPEWDSSVEYINNKSFVIYNGLSYKCIQTHTNQNPSTATAYWVRAFNSWSTVGEAVSTLTMAADQYIYFSGPNTAVAGTITPFARSILDDVNGAAVVTTIGAQPLDATLTALAGLATATNKLPYFTGTDVAAVTDITAFGRDLLADADATSGRATLGLGTAATATLTTTTVDATTGRVLRVGDFGLGTHGAGVIADANITGSGLSVYSTSDTSANAPNSWGTLLNVRGNVSGHGFQIAKGNGQDSFWMRGSSGTTPFPYATWKELWHSGNFDPSSKANVAAPSFTGNVTIGNAFQANAGSTGIEVGRTDGTAGTGYIDFHSGATPVDYDVRVQCTGGDGTSGKGTIAVLAGAIDLSPAVGAVQLRYAGTVRYATTSTGSTMTGGLLLNQQGEAIALRGNTTGVASSTHISFEQSDGTRDGYVGVASTTTTDIHVSADTGDVLIRPILGSSILHEAGAVKLTTTSTGISVTGQIVSSLPTYTNLTLAAPFIWDSAGDAASYHQPSYTKVDNVVRLRGKVTLSGTHNDNSTVNLKTIATLPVGFRPAKRKAFSIFWDTDAPLYFNHCLIFVNTDGTIVFVIAPDQPYPFTEGHFPLDQIWFDLA